MIGKKDLGVGRSGETWNELEGSGGKEVPNRIRYTGQQYDQETGSIT